ncbi:MAG: transcription-repair coupling factor [Calditrichia bacterium]
MLKLKSIVTDLPEFETFREKLFSGYQIYIKGINGSFLSFVLNYVVDTLENSLLAVVPDTEQAEKLTDDLQSLMPARRVLYFPQAEIVPFDNGSFAPALHSARLNALVSLLENPASVIVTTPISLLQKIDPPELIAKQVSHIKVGDQLDRDFLIEWLVESGFERMQSIEEIGQFSARGGIVDVFSFEAGTPYRIEFFDDNIESIREFDVLSQMSIRQVEQVRIVGANRESSGNATLFDYLKSGAVIFWDDMERTRKMIDDWLENAQRLYDEGEERSSDPSQVYLSQTEIQKFSKSYRQIYHSHFQNAENTDVNFNVQPPLTFHGNIKLLTKHLYSKLGRGKKNGQNIFIVYDKPARRERLEEIILAEMDWLPPVKFIQGDIHNGFLIPGISLEILTEHEIFDRIKARRNRRKLQVSGSIIRQLNSLKYGDYVVHVDYGIGKYIGTEQISVVGVQKDCLKIEYDEQDILYVNLDKLNHVQKYVSEEGFNPPLTHLGSTEWERAKDKTRKSVENIAKDLVKLYASRMQTDGFSFAEDTLWQKELEASFMYADTPDQSRATRDVKADMERDKPMDRLICGDVGFGKTEVAIRAAFKAVNDGKQVAVLVPTTILAQQHFYTFRERMKNFPVNIEVLSRFRTRAEQKKVLDRLHVGDVDILIGTHRLLSGDVEFKDIGLLVVDEEQQFGVKHKERLRQLKVSVDTLTLTATPIPRTLQMSLMGARDLSNIDTPPRNRHPIITEICTWEKELIYRAITYEMDRGGQIFFVHNRVQTIQGVAEILKQTVPQARIAVAHGQMHEHDLERIMNDFYAKKYDVLLATMIIENGLDIPNCNTIIINRADRFGLAQLYQLRGRVGRSDRQAYAYLIVPPHDRLNDTSLKRLYAIEEFTDLGSGLKIAMRDLEIRGAGNLLGHQQSGYINAVGYDLYQKILRETVEKLQDEILPSELVSSRMPHVDAAVDVDSDMYIPDSYIESSNEKVMIYHRLLNLDSLVSIDNLAKELRDRFGPLPEEARKLVEMVKIKRLASQRFIKQVKISKNNMTMALDDSIVETDYFIEKELPRYINQKIAPVDFSQTEGFRVHLRLTGKTPMDYLTFAKNFLQSL